MLELLFPAIILVIVFNYVLLVVYILKTWESQAEFSPKENTRDNNYTFSILIAARNEAETILHCLKSILENESCPEVIVVDDHSDDGTAKKVQGIQDPRIKLFKLSDNTGPDNFSKKAALSFGLSQCSGDYIIQLDADVVVKSTYLSSVYQYINENQPDFLAAPIQFNKGSSILEEFQEYDLAGMMALTQAGIMSGNWYMANGANMIFKRKGMSYKTKALASGDDVFGIQHVINKGGKADYLKSRDAVAYTRSLTKISELYDQRIRWATKNKYIQSNRMKYMMALVFLTHISLLAYIPGTFFLPVKTVYLLIAFHVGTVCLTDYIYLSRISEFFEIKRPAGRFLIIKFYHWAYICTIGLLSLFVRKYNWKGRSLS